MLWPSDIQLADRSGESPSDIKLANRSGESRYGNCFECGVERVGSGWCRICEIRALINNFNNWTSGNKGLDYVIQTTQRNAIESVDFLEWIPWERFILTEYSGKGAFSTVYRSYWIEGPRWIWDEEAESWTRNGPIKVVIKRIDNSHNITDEYLNKILKYHRCIQSGSVADCFGMTRDATGCYAFVMRFYENGNLYEFLDHAMGILCWRDIIDMLWGISGGLYQIHKDNGLYHGNLHGGNLLVENEPESIDTRIADVGLHGPADRSTNMIYGVLPYVAPEVLRGEPYTQAADIYSFGIIMWTLSAGIKPFCDRAHDKDLAHDICNNTRPEIVDGTPEVFKELMVRCWNHNPQDRPKVSEIYEKLGDWVAAICDNPDPSPLSNQFDAAEEKKFLDLENKTFVQPEIHPLAKYTSQPLFFPELRGNGELNRISEN